LEKTVLYDGITSRRKHPKNYQEDDARVFMHELEKDIHPTYLCTFGKVIVTTHGVVYENMKVIMESLIAPSKHKEFGLWSFLKILLKMKARNPGKGRYLLPYNAWGIGYGHFITETLPRLLVVKDILAESILLLPEKIHPEILNALKPFKFKELLLIPENNYLKLPELYMPTLTGQTGNYNDELMKQLRKFERDYYSPDQVGEPVKVYLSRAKAVKRKIANEEELLPILGKYNFQTVYVEELSFDQQVELFMRCRCLISIHGATLANMLFMEASTQVLEIRNVEDTHALCYFSLASALEIDYYYHRAEPQDPSLANNSDLIVDPALFEQTLKSMK